MSNIPHNTSVLHITMSNIPMTRTEVLCYYVEYTTEELRYCVTMSNIPHNTSVLLITMSNIPHNTSVLHITMSNIPHKNWGIVLLCRHSNVSSSHYYV